MIPSTPLLRGLFFKAILRLSRRSARAKIIVRSWVSSVANLWNVTALDAGNNSIGFNNNCAFNPLDKVVELYERMLKDKSDRRTGMIITN